MIPPWMNLYTVASACDLYALFCHWPHICSTKLIVLRWIDFGSVMENQSRIKFQRQLTLKLLEFSLFFHVYVKNFAQIGLNESSQRQVKITFLWLPIVGEMIFFCSVFHLKQIYLTMIILNNLIHSAFYFSRKHKHTYYPKIFQWILVI